MLIRVRATGTSSTVDVEALDRFTEFSVVADRIERNLLGDALERAEAGTYEHGHAWIRRRFIEDHAPGDDAAWADRFSAMLAYADGKGWVSDDGESIRAHVIDSTAPG